MINTLKLNTSLPVTHTCKINKNNNKISFKGELNKDSVEISDIKFQKDLKVLDNKFAELMKDENLNEVEIKKTIIESFNLLKKNHFLVSAESQGHLAIDKTIKYNLQNDPSNETFIKDYIKVLQKRISLKNLESVRVETRKTAITSLEIYTKTLQSFIPLDEHIKTLASKGQLIKKIDVKNWNDLKIFIKNSLELANCLLKIGK